MKFLNFQIFCRGSFSHNWNTQAFLISSGQPKTTAFVGQTSDSMLPPVPEGAPTKTRSRIPYSSQFRCDWSAGAARGAPTLAALLLTSSLSPAQANQPELNDNMFFFNNDDERIAMASADNSTTGAATMKMTIFAAAEPAPSENESPMVDDQEFNYLFHIDSGYRHDTVEWDVAAPGGAPNTQMTAEWQDIEMAELKGGFNIGMPYGLTLNGQTGYAWTVDGAGRQQYFLGDNQTRLFSDTRHDGSNGDAWNVSLALGRAFIFGSPESSPVWFKATPLAGYAWRQQDLSLRNGQQQLNATGFSTQTANVENDYRMRMHGPWLGMDLNLSILQSHQLFASFQHHWADYQGKGRWRQAAALLEQPLGFEHSTDITGIVASAGYRFFARDGWGLSLAFDYQKWDGESGVERSFLSDGNELEARLNDISQESVGVNFGINMRF